MDLEQGILVARLAVAATPGDAKRAKRLSILSFLLHSRYKRLDAREDLEGAIRIGEEAIEATGPDMPKLSECCAISQTTVSFCLKNWEPSKTLIRLFG